MALASTQQDVVSLLTEDHENVRGLFKRLERAQGQDAKKLLQQIRTELEIHTAVEEEIVYPEFRKSIGDHEAKVTVQESLMEHNVVDYVLGELEGLDASSPEFEGRCIVLKELVEHHARDEEKEMFPRFRKQSSKEALVRLGQRVMERKEELKESRGRRSAASSRGAGKSEGSRASGEGRRGTKSPTKEELYKEAQKKNIEGRSEMTKDELMRALKRR